MLYLGHFTFYEEPVGGTDQKFGHFSCVVEAKTPAATEKAFKKLLLDTRKRGNLFQGNINIYNEAIIEIGALPKLGVITWFHSSCGDGPGGIDTFFPHEDTGGCKAYYLLPDNRPDLSEQISTGESHTMEPFIVFEHIEP